MTMLSSSVDCKTPNKKYLLRVQKIEKKYLKLEEADPVKTHFNDVCAFLTSFKLLTMDLESCGQTLGNLFRTVKPLGKPPKSMNQVLA
jgi:hypothetical protein